jgi:hypothetical protein
MYVALPDLVLADTILLCLFRTPVPLQFFQNNDNSKNDAINLALLVAGLYLVFKFYSELETLK